MKTIELPWPDRDLQSNGRADRWTKARKTKAARNLARCLCLERPRVECIPDARLVFEYYPKGFYGDVHNVPSSLKAYIDGIADAMGCDDKKFRVTYPEAWKERSDPPKIVCKIYPAFVSIPVLGQIS